MRQRLPLILSITAVPLAVAALVIALLGWAGITALPTQQRDSGCAGR